MLKKFDLAERCRWPDPPLVAVYWLDACYRRDPAYNMGYAGWPKDAKFGIVNKTVGFQLCQQTKGEDGFIALAAEFSPEQASFRDVTEIPVSLIIKIEELRPGQRARKAKNGRSKNHKEG